MRTKMWTILVAIMMFAGVASADPTQDTRVDVTNNINNTATGGNAQQTQNQHQGQDQNQAASAIVQGNLPEVGFVGFLNPGVPIVGTEWKFYYSNLYAKVSVKKIDKMRWGFHFSDILPSHWGGRVQFTAEGEGLGENQDDVALMHYWPEVASNPGDEVLGSVIVVGERDWPDSAFLGEALAACKSNTGTRRVAVAYSEYVDGVTTGASLGVSGSTAQVGGDASGYVIASGGMIGKNKTRAERVRRVQALCMNDGPLYLPGKPTLPPPPPVPCAKPEVCNPEGFLQQIEIWKEACLHCKKPCFNNEKLRKCMGDTYLDLYHCTGDRRYLELAIKEYDIAQRDFKNGHEPDGVRTRNMKGAQKIAYMANYNKSWAIRELHGRDAQIRFAHSVGLKTMPSCYEDLKR